MRTAVGNRVTCHVRGARRTVRTASRRRACSQPETAANPDRIVKDPAADGSSARAARSFTIRPGQCRTVTCKVVRDQSAGLNVSSGQSDQSDGRAGVGGELHRVPGVSPTRLQVDDHAGCTVMHHNCSAVLDVVNCSDGCHRLKGHSYSLFAGGIAERTDDHHD